MQFTDSKYRCNHVLALSFRPVKTTAAHIVGCNENNGENDFEEVVSDCDDLIEFDHDNENTVNLSVRSEQELRESYKIEVKQNFG